MKKFLIGLLIVGGALAVISMIAKRRSETGSDEWGGSFADDSAARASKATETVTEATTDAASKVSEATKKAASKVTEATKEAASKVADATKEAAAKVTEAAKEA
jgi:rRNA maturation endonuclease Nob1